MMKAIPFGFVENGVRMTSAAAVLAAEANIVLAQEAEFLKAGIRSGLRSQSPGGRRLTPLAQVTLDLRTVGASGRSGKKRKKAGTKALIYNADMLNSVNVTKVKKSEFFVGIHRKERSTFGERLYNIAMIQEEGSKPYSIPVTESLHRFFIFLKIEGIVSGIPRVGSTIKHPGLKARPFLVPAFNEWQKKSEKRYANRMLSKMGPYGFRMRG